MKNIHLIPTDNYSTLVYSTNKYGGLFLSKYYSPTKDMGDSYQNIYITSNEEIKEGDWIKWGEAIYKANKKYMPPFKKVILTTDQDLIKDGVQAIDDEFLEWFVKNPSCEEVDIMTDSYTMNQFFELKLRPDIFKYKLIIPEEEPKQEIVKDLVYWKANAEEDYMKVPISVLRYISELENQMYSEKEVLAMLLIKHDGLSAEYVLEQFK